MNKVLILEPIALAGETGYDAICKVQIGKLQAQLTLGYYPDKEGDDRYDVKKPDSISALESAGMELDYSEVVEKYKQVVANADKYREDTKKAALANEYDQSYVAGLTLPTVAGAAIRLETKEEYIARRIGGNFYLRRSTNPLVFIAVDDVEVRAIYRDTAGYNTYGKRMRFVISHKITDRKDRQYSKLETCVKKIVELVPQYKEQEATKERARIIRKNAAEARENWITSNFPNAEKEKYGNGYSIEVAGVKNKLDSARAKDSRENNTAFYFADIKNPLTREQVLAIIAVLEGVTVVEATEFHTA